MTSLPASRPGAGARIRSAKGAAASLTLALAIGGTGSAQQHASTDLAAELLAPTGSDPASSEPGALPAPWRRAGRPQESAPQQEAQEPERWSSFLPLLKEEALARGYQLPLPFGAGVTATILTGRDIDVTDLRVGVDGEEPSSVSQFVDLGSESDVFNANLKLDAWILPFLNVYTLFGYVYNESKTNLHVMLPGREFDMDVDTKLDGFVGGGGLTLAAGYGEFFMVIDSNYSQTDIGFDDSFRAVTASMRAGYQATLGQKPCQIWLGGAYWDTANTAKGSTDVPGVGRVDFEADQGPVYPWLVDFGGNLRIAPGFEFFVDLAFDLHGGAIFTIGPVFRF